MSFINLSKEDRDSAIGRTKSKVNGGRPLQPGNPATCYVCHSQTAGLYLTGDYRGPICSACDDKAGKA